MTASARQGGGPPPRPIFPLRGLFNDLPVIKVIDVGASDIDGDPPYHPLLADQRVQVVGFEPDTEQYARLQKLKRPNTTYLQDAIGDGADGTLHICKAPGMTSLLEPDPAVLDHFHGFSEWGTVLRTEPCATRRLDEIPETEGAHYMKIDVQGGELNVLRGAPARLGDVLVCHIEVQFVPFYKNQPLFAELDQALREAGFYLHRFLPIHSRIFKPMVIRKDIFAGLSQQLWSDAVFVKRFTDFAAMDDEHLLTIATIAHDCYRSFDLAALALRRIDERRGTQRMQQYVRKLAPHLGGAGRQR